MMMQFTNTRRLIGDATHNQMAMNARNTVFDMKRLLGREFNDAWVQQDMQQWPLKVVYGPREQPLVEGR